MIKATIASTAITQQKSPCLVVGVYERNKLSDAAKKLDQLSKKGVSKFLKLGDFAGKHGQTQFLYHLPGVNAERVLLVGCGVEKKLTLAKFRTLAQKVAAALQEAQLKEAHCYLNELTLKEVNYHLKMQQALLGIAETDYAFEDFKSKKNKSETSSLKIHWMLESDQLKTAQVTFKQTQAITQGIKTTKNLANTPGNICHPSYIANYAMKLAKSYPKMTCKVLQESDLKKRKMGAFLAVSQGSAQPPKLVCLEYKGGKTSAKPIVLVGKGITFDTGGVSLKPSASMMGMKFDMCGAATVMGVLHAAATMKLPLNIVGVMACAENMPSSKASRPDDIVTTMSGQTVEIANTDAEGRLVLCDALTYSQKTYSPATLIDIATLTGACVVALGSHASGLYANKQRLADKLLAAGEKILDRAWQMPLWEDYQSQLNSPVADMCHIGGQGAGSITAACFLSRFTEETNWAHLDIAGTAASKMSRDGLATGRPVAMLTQFLIDSI